VNYIITYKTNCGNDSTCRIRCGGHDRALDVRLLLYKRHHDTLKQKVGVGTVLVVVFSAVGLFRVGA